MQTVAHCRVRNLSLEGLEKGLPMAPAHEKDKHIIKGCKLNHWG